MPVSAPGGARVRLGVAAPAPLPPPAARGPVRFDLPPRLGSLLGGAPRRKADVLDGLNHRPILAHGHYLPYQDDVNAVMRRGSEVDGVQMAALKARGFKAIVNLRWESNKNEAPAKLLGMNHLHLLIPDGTAPTLQQMLQFLEFARKPENQPLYVHCAAGIGRTGVAVAVWRIAVEGWSAGDAIAEAGEYANTNLEQLHWIAAFAHAVHAGQIPPYPLA